MIPLCVVLVMSSFVHAQLISISKNYLHVRRSAPSFNDRYQTYRDYSIKLKDTAFFYEKGIKRINVLDRTGTVYRYFELDSNGRAFKVGMKGRNYYLEITENHPNDSTKQIIHQYRNIKTNDVERIDSFVYIARSRVINDSLIQYTDHYHQTTKSGHLINLQNKHYNAKIKYKRTPKFLKSNYKMYKLSRAYQKAWPSKFKTNYDSLTLYRCSVTESVYGPHFVEPQIQYLSSDHPTYKKLVTSNTSYSLKSEKYKEPYKRIDPMTCGTGESNYRNSIREVNGTSKMNYNREGFCTKFTYTQAAFEDYSEYEIVLFTFDYEYFDYLNK